MGARFRPVNTIAIPKKVWSPNSPFGRENAVFSLRQAESLCARGKARLVAQEDALASITSLLEPRQQWNGKWVREKMVKMGMPRRGVANLVLVFQGKFSEAIIRIANERFQESQALDNYNRMVNDGRNPMPGDGREGVARWTGRPSLKSKVAGGPAMSTQQMIVGFKKKKGGEKGNG